MKKISFVVTRDYQNNRIFDLSNPVLNRDNCLYPYFLLREEFKKNNYDIVTCDLLEPAIADIVLYNEMPKPFPAGIDPTKSFLMLFETELIRKDNWDFEKHSHFKKVFTWNDDYVDGERYIKFNFPNSIKLTPPGMQGRETLATLISGNKTSSHPKELYGERLKTIRWFEKNQPLHFHYYGVGWDYFFDVRWQKILKKLHLLSFIPKHKSPCYRGKVKDKNLALKQYKFAICYENAKGINGYITEKIFDCFFAGCVPVYWGPDNIEKFIPKDCYVDRRDFKSHEELFIYMNNFPEDKILEKQQKINDFLKSSDAKKFSDEYFVENIIRNIINV